MFLTKILKKLIIVTISFAFLLTFCFIAACRGPEAAEIVETTEEIAEEVEEPAEEEAAEPEVEVEEVTEEETSPAVEVSGYEIGEEIMVYDSSTGDPICSLIIHSVDNFTKEGREPSWKMRYVTFKCELKNLTDDGNIEYSGSNYVLMDVEGNIHKDLGANNEPVFISGTFLPDDIIIAWRTIEVPEDIAITAVVANPCFTDTIYIVLDTPLGP